MIYNNDFDNCDRAINLIGTQVRATGNTLHPDLFNIMPIWFNGGQFDVFRDNWGYQIRGEETYTTSGDGSTVEFTLPVNNFQDNYQYVDGAIVTPMSEDAKGEFYLNQTGSSSIQIVYTSAPSSGTDNLQWSYRYWRNPEDLSG